MLKNLHHYYGDIVRIVFMSSAVIMLLGMSFFKELIPVPFPTSLFILLALAFFAGFTSPVQGWVSVVNIIIASVGSFYFQYAAFTQSYALNTTKDVIYFSINQLLAVAYFLALYFSIKTVRAMWFEKEFIVDKK